jgi:hypothetical protein
MFPTPIFLPKKNKVYGTTPMLLKNVMKAGCRIEEIQLPSNLILKRQPLASWMM